MADVPLIQVLPPLRCCQQDLDSMIGICGRPAVVRRPGLARAGNAFYCREHELAGDEEITGEVIFRRVSITLEVIFAGTSPMPGLARAEAIDRLERAVEHVGGVVSLQAATDHIARYVPPAPRRKGINGHHKAE